MFEFVCDRIVPGCDHTDRDEARERLMERVAAHLREHHDLDHRDERVAAALDSTGVTFIRPA